MMGVSFFAMLSGFMLSQSALAAITIAAPVNGTKVSSPVWVRAHNTGCNGLSPTAFGYSVDNSSTLVKGVTVYDVDTKASMASGTHTIHYKSWTSAGVCPTVSTTFSVSGGSTSSGSTSSTSTAYSLPSYAVPSAALEGVGGWSAVHDSGTPGGSKGSMVYPTSISSYDYARKFYMTYYDHGGERWHVGFGNNASSTHFVLDTYVYLVNPSQVQNLELDLNQVMGNGQTVIYGTQCSSISKTWEYVIVYSGHPHWKASNIGCNPLTWAAKTWHHVQIGFHRNSYGVVTHDWVNLDGAHHVFSGTTYNAALSLGWAKGSLTTNLQIDGEYSGSGSVTAYAHKMIFYHW
ncbi:MAG TPA: hypothetical protein VF126_12400 [Acidobacteriaceae bacterium]